MRARLSSLTCVQWVAIFAAGISSLWPGIIQAANPPKTIEPIQIVVTIPVLKDLTEQVGGAHVHVLSLLSGLENEHTYSPKPSDIIAVRKARLLVEIGVGLEVSDRSPGWGLGSHAFLLGGVGRARTDQQDGSRYFAEGGGGVTTGPLGVDISVKVATNRFSIPASHSFLTIPVSVRGTLSF